MNTKGNHGRHVARKKALQALYQWDLSGTDIPQILQQFAQYRDMGKADVGYFEQLVRGVAGQIDKLDARISRHTGRPAAQLDPVERNTLRLCSYELVALPDLPCRVAINEAIELTKIYGAEQGYKFVNGVADKIARELRSAEMCPGT